MVVLVVVVVVAVAVAMADGRVVVDLWLVLWLFFLVVGYIILL